MLLGTNSGGIVADYFVLCVKKNIDGVLYVCLFEFTANLYELSCCCLIIPTNYVPFFCTNFNL